MIDVRLIGANPGLTLFAEADDDLPIAYASAWRVDWSIVGAGNVLISWIGGVTRAVSENPELARWLATDFNRFFPEVSRLPWPEPEIVPAPVVFECDLASGAHIEADGVTVDMREPLTTRFVQVDSFPLGETSIGLSTLITMCRLGSIEVGGVALPGSPKVERDPIGSSSFLANAEVWYTHDSE